jgi:hypothetical protein
MKKYLFILTFLVIGCGVNESEYNRVKSERDSLLQVVDELKNGEERLLNFITMYNNNKDYIQAYKNLERLRKHHPESPLFETNKKLFSSLENKAITLIDSINKVKNDSIKLANIDELGIWEIGDFVNDFDEPTGKHFVYSNVYGHFSNSATSYDKLRIYIRWTGDEKQYNVSLKFDEYDNGTYDIDFNYNQDELQYIKIINKELRKVYTGEKYYIRERVEDNSNNRIVSLKEILVNEGIYTFTLKYKHNTEYSFQIESSFLNNALIKAGLKDINE